MFKILDIIRGTYILRIEITKSFGIGFGYSWNWWTANSEECIRDLIIAFYRIENSHGTLSYNFNIGPIMTTIKVKG